MSGLSVFDAPALFEVKPGPYRPLAEGDFAPWAPPGADVEAFELLHRWETLAAATAPRG